MATGMVHLKNEAIMQKAGVSNHDRVMIRRFKAADKTQEETSRALRIKLEVIKKFWDDPKPKPPRLSARSKSE